MENSRFPYSKKSQGSSFDYQKLDSNSPRSMNGDFSFAGGNDRRYAFSRQSSFQQSSAVAEPQTPIAVFTNDSAKPFLSRTVSSIDIPQNFYSYEKVDHVLEESKGLDDNFSIFSFISLLYRGVRLGNKQMKKLFLLISLNVAYSTAELVIGIFSGRVGLVSDAFHLTFGCGLLTFSLFAMATSRKKSDCCYTYGYKRLEVLSAFTNALFLLFMSFSLAVEALHAFIQDESEHKHYMIVSAVTNLLVNLIGVWFFRNYARINLVYRNAEDMNYHSVFLHVLADSIRSAGLILASWLLALGYILLYPWIKDTFSPNIYIYIHLNVSVVPRVNNAEVLCLGLVSVTVFMLVIPLFKTTGGILLQMAPPSIPSSALSKCWRQVASHENVSEISQARFWEMVPGHVIGSILLQVKKGVDDRPILHYVHNLYHDLGVQDLTVQIDYI